MSEAEVTQENVIAASFEPAVRMKSCAKCGKPFPLEKAFKFCPEHRVKSAADRTEANRQYQDKHRTSEKAVADAKAAKFNSKDEVTKNDALELLAQRVTNSHVQEVVYELGTEAAKAHGILPNVFYWTNGLQQAIKSREAHRERPLELDHAAVIPSEVIHQGDLYAIWDFSVSHREPDVAFEDFISMRKILKLDWFTLGQFLNVPLEEQPHRGWAEFLPSFVPDLRPGYSMQEMREWLMRQKSVTHPEARDFLLQAARGSMKSSAGTVFLVAATLCCPSLRLLLVSETTDMTRKFLKAYKAVWETNGDSAYERFQRFFPEFCIRAGDGNSKAFTSPMRHLAVREETAEMLSMEMAAQGRRFDIAWIDDCIGKTNTLNAEQREKGMSTYGAILKLRETGAGLVITIGTPWVAPEEGEVGDLYFELMKRFENDPELAVKVEPAWVLKPESAHLFPDHLNQLTDDHVESLAFPSRLTFKMLMKEARFNLDEFRTQFLCEYVQSEASKYAVTFTDDDLRQRVRHPDYFESYPLQMIVAAVDTAFSESMVADRSVISIAKVYQVDGKNVAFITHVVAGRWRYSDLAVQIVDAFSQHHVQRAVIERSGAWQELEAAVMRIANIRGYVLPNIHYKQPTSSPIPGVKAKIYRAKGLEVTMNAGQVFFAAALWNDAAFYELVRFNGAKSSAKKKDDHVDSFGSLVESFIVPDLGVRKPTELQLQEEADAQRRALIQEQYNTVFGNRIALPSSPEPEIVIPELPLSPMGNLGLQIFGRNGMRT